MRVKPGYTKRTNLPSTQPSRVFDLLGSPGPILPLLINSSPELHEEAAPEQRGAPKVASNTATCGPVDVGSGVVGLTGAMVGDGVIGDGVGAAVGSFVSPEIEYSRLPNQERFKCGKVNGSPKNMYASPVNLTYSSLTTGTPF